MKTKIENAVISGTMFGIEDHGIMTAMVYLSGDGWGGGFGWEVNPHIWVVSSERIKP